MRLLTGGKPPALKIYPIPRTSIIAISCLSAMRDGKVAREEAVEEIANRFMKWTQIFVDVKKAKKPI